MDTNLEDFIDFLEEHNLMEFDIDGNEDRQFTNRLKLQKYVLLAKHLGMPFRYQYGMYLYGPYSSVLAADYYELARDDSQNKRLPATTPNEFKKDDFLKAVNNDPEWLEIAATIIDRNEHTKDRTTLMEKVCRIKSEFSEEIIAGVLKDLEEHHLVSFRA